MSEKDIMEMCNRISSMFSYSLLEWVFYLDQIEKDTLMKYLDEVLRTRVCENMITFMQGCFSKELLTEILDKIPVTIGIDIKSGIPVDFRHPKALKFSTMEYREARWITVDDLKSVRIPGSVMLGTTNFDCSDINEFLKYWVDCDEFMMESMSLNMKESTVINRDVILDQLMAVQFYSDVGYHVYVKAKNHKNLESPLGVLDINAKNKIEFWAFKSDEYSEIYGMLESLEKKKDLEMELKNLEDSRDKRKEEISTELEQLTKQLNEKEEKGFIFTF
ncbi:hypothetical protein GCK72_004692 [Caenorhabditis remanei]|nr:hypothetical protein GCK72_004692 [Caenorhabditis remanei]KAF1764742.1 hypothetical protein GCK72_004692 [Caenorhabditis remanei]